jgi:hypothetical protein
MQKTVKRFPACNYGEDCIQEQGTGKNYKVCIRLCTGRKYWSVAVAMAGKIRGAINAYLELFVTFWGDAKK